MTDTQIAVQEKANGLAPWGSREEVKEIAARLKKFVPGTKKMNDTEIMAYAQLVHMTGLNPCSSELHGWDTRGDGTGTLATKIHYGVTIRWAKNQENFTTDFTCIAIGSKSEATIYECQLLRQSDRPLLGQLLAGGANYKEALSWATSKGLGIIEAREKSKKKPPKGKDWPWMARKRALEDAIHQAFGKSTTQELARQTWIVEGVKTTPADWEDVTPEMLPIERQANAKFNAEQRQRAEEKAEHPTRSAAQDIAELYGEEIVNGETGEIVEPEPTQEEEPEETNGLDKLFAEVNARLIENTLEPYANKENMVVVLKAIGHKKYKPTNHATLIGQLIAQREPNGKNHQEPEETS